jgi:glucose/arabinose dehydrogenase
VLWDEDGDGSSSENERATLAQYTELNHAVVIQGEYIYASNPREVLRWRYQAGDRSNLGEPELVIFNIPCCHHVTRTIRFDSSGLIYVQVGSQSNVGMYYH